MRSVISGVTTFSVLVRIRIFVLALGTTIFLETTPGMSRRFCCACRGCGSGAASQALPRHERPAAGAWSTTREALQATGAAGAAVSGAGFESQPAAACSAGGLLRDAQPLQLRLLRSGAETSLGAGASAGSASSYRFGCRLINQLGRFPVVVLSSLARRERNFGSSFLRLYFDGFFDLGSLFRFFEDLALQPEAAVRRRALRLFWPVFCPLFWRLQLPFSFPPLALWPLPLLFARESFSGWSRQNSHRSSQSAKKHTDPDASVQRALPDSLLNILSPVPRPLFYPFAQRPLTTFTLGLVQVGAK